MGKYVLSCIVAGLLFSASLADAASYYTSTVGNNSNSCTTAKTGDVTITNAKLTVAAGIACLTVPGDTLWVRAGSYSEQLQMSMFPTAGLSASPITVAAYPNETVQFIGTAGGSYIIYGDVNKAFVVFNRIIWDGTTAGATLDADATKNLCTRTDGLSFNMIYLSTGIDITFQNGEIRNSRCVGILAVGVTRLNLLENKIHHNGTTQDYGNTNGAYLSIITNSLIRGNEAYHNECFGIRIYDSDGTQGTSSGNTVINNWSHDNGAEGTGPSGANCASQGGGFVIGNNTNTLAHNLATNNTGIGFYFFKESGATAANLNKAYNNTAYGNSQEGIKVATSVTNTSLTNNLSIGNTGTQISDLGTGTISTTNRSTGVITDCTQSTSDFTQRASSACLNAGTAIAGFAFNDSAPDIGAFEKMTFSTCSVENGDASNLRVTWNNTAFPSLGPSSGVTGFTARKAGVADTLGNGVLVGTNRMDFALTNAIIGGDAVDVSVSSTNLHDSANIGGSLTQPFVQVLANQPCTNNVGGGASGVVTQTVFRFNGLRGTQAAPVATPYATAPENTNILVVPGGSVRLRFGLSCTIADCPPKGFIPRFSHNGGAYTVAPDTFSTDNFAFAGTSPDPDIPNSGTTTTQQLSGSGTFVACAIVRTSNAIPTVDMALNGRTECEYAFTWSTQTVQGDTYQFRLYNQDGTPIDGYTVTPKATIIGTQAGSGF